MKNMKVKSFLLALPLLLTALTGCGGGDNKQSQSPGDTSGATGNKVTIKWWITFGQTVQDALNDKIEKFTKLVKENEGVDVTIDMKYQGDYDVIAKKISDGYATMNTPTIAVAYPDNVADYLEVGKSANAEYVVNMDQFINDQNIGFGKERWLGDRYEEDDFIEDFYREGSSYGVAGTYSLPFLKSTEIMFYNMNLLTEVMKGYKPEFDSSELKIKQYMSRLTWDEFINLCRYTKEHMEDISNVLEVPMFYDSDANLFVTKMYQNNIGYSSIDPATGKGKIDFRDGTNFDKTVDMLDDFRQLYADGLMTTKGIKNTYGSDFFTGEKCLFSIGSSGGSGYNFPQAEAFTLGVCRVPVSNNNPLYVSQGPTLAMFNDRGLTAEENAMRLKYAWKFMKYLTNGQVSAEICVNGSEGYVPVRYSAYDTSFFQEFMEEGERYAMCYKVVVEDVNSNAGYLVSPAFKGSATLRDEVGSLLTASLTAANKEAIPALVNRAISNATLKM